jgi:hypothetical protein
MLTEIITSFLAVYCLLFVFSFINNHHKEQPSHPSTVHTIPPPVQPQTSFPSNPVIRMQLKKKGVDLSGIDIYDEDALRRVWLECVQVDQCDFRDREKYRTNNK